MTEETALGLWSIYAKMVPSLADESLSYREAVVAEVGRVVLASTEAEAADVIEWWDCWDERYTAKRWAKRFRDRARKVGLVARLQVGL